LGRKDAIRNADDVSEELEEIVQHLGSIVQSAKLTAQKGGLLKFYLDLPHIVDLGHYRVLKHALKKFATIEDVASLLDTYSEYFDRSLDDKIEAPIPEVVDFGSAVKTTTDCDFGIEIETFMFWEMLN